MLSSTIRIVAIGGGGCTNGSDPELDRWILSLLPPDCRRVGFIGAASRDDRNKHDGFRAAFAGKADLAPPLPSTANAEACTRWLAGLDLVYAGGGNTALLLETIRGHGWDRPLAAAAERGAILAGVSAGAMCWFEEGFSDSGGTGFRPLRGLGLVRGTCCPHYSDEPERKPAFEAAVAVGTVADGLAIDDGAAVLCDAGGPIACFSARPGHGAYRLARGGEAPGMPTVQPVPSVG